MVSVKSIFSFKLVALIKTAVVLLLLCGCSADSPEIKEIQGDIQLLADQLSRGGASRESGYAVYKKISQQKSGKVRARLYGECERIIFGVRFDSPNFSSRNVQVGCFRTLADVCASCSELRGGDKFDELCVRLRILKRLKDEANAAESLRGSNAKVKYVGVHWDADLYADSVSQVLDEVSVRFEEQFNRLCLDRLTLEQRKNIQVGFERIMNRPIRTKSQIVDDRKRRNDEDLRKLVLEDISSLTNNVLNGRSPDRDFYKATERRVAKLPHSMRKEVLKHFEQVFVNMTLEGISPSSRGRAHDVYSDILGNLSRVFTRAIHE